MKVLTNKQLKEIVERLEEIRDEIWHGDKSDSLEDSDSQHAKAILKILGVSD